MVFSSYRDHPSSSVIKFYFKQVFFGQVNDTEENVKPHRHNELYTVTCYSDVLSIFALSLVHLRRPSWHLYMKIPMSNLSSEQKANQVAQEVCHGLHHHIFNTLAIDQAALIFKFGVYLFGVYALLHCPHTVLQYLRYGSISVL